VWSQKNLLISNNSHFGRPACPAWWPHSRLITSRITKTRTRFRCGDNDVVRPCMDCIRHRCFSSPIFSPQSPSLASLNMPEGSSADSETHSEHSEASTKTSSTKLNTDCRQQHAASLHCIQEHYEDKNACLPFFEAYKQCRAEENKRRLEANAKRYFW